MTIPIVPGSDTGTWKSWINTIVAAIQTLFNARAAQSYRWADATARAAQTGMVAGDTGYQIDNTITYRYNGTAWKAWSSDRITYNVTATNFAVGGTGTLVGTYAILSGFYDVEVKAVLASGFTAPNAPAINPPTTMPTYGTLDILGMNSSILAAGSRYLAAAVFSTTTSVRLMAINTAAANALLNSPTSTVPGTFTTNDELVWRFRYPA